MATVAPTAQARLSFWQKMAIGLALLIVLGFLQFALRGYVNIAQVPAYTHLHGMVMLGWLAVTVIQPTLAERADISLHRKMGLFGATMAAGVVVLGIYTARHVIAAGREPPFFTPPYFLALTHIGMLAFAGVVIAAILMRRDTQWHRRLMLGSTVLLMEPALGRLLPMPLIMPWGEWIVLLVQLLAMAFVVRHDRGTLGRVHPATLAVIAVLFVTHVAVETAARLPLTAALVNGMIGTAA